MEKIMIVSSSLKGKEMIQEILKSKEYSIIITSSSGAEAKRKLQEEHMDIVIINCPLSDEFGLELAEEITSKSSSAVALIVKNDVVDQTEYRAEKFGAFVISKPISKQLFYQSMRMLSAASTRMKGLHKENTKLREKIEEIKLVDRAKHALIQYLNMTEPSAHRYIEKQAMDMRISRKQVAKSILKTYEI